MQLYKNKYRVKSTRLPDWDYGSDGYYFVTICTKNKKCFFGKPVHLSPIGQIAYKYWLEIPDHFPHVSLDEFVIMPNHVHGIIVIKNDVENVETQNFTSLRPPSSIKNKFGPQSKNLGSIVRGFKIGVKKHATMNDIEFAWQPRYYEHIVRDENALDRIREYIRCNPNNWNNDRFNT